GLAGRRLVGRSARSTAVPRALSSSLPSGGEPTRRARHGTRRLGGGRANQRAKGAGAAAARDRPGAPRYHTSTARQAPGRRTRELTYRAHHGTRRSARPGSRGGTTPVPYARRELARVGSRVRRRFGWTSAGGPIGQEHRG